MEVIWIELLAPFARAAEEGVSDWEKGAVLQWEKEDALRMIKRGAARHAKAPTGK